MERVPQSHILAVRAVCWVAGNVKRRGVIDVDGNGIGARLEPQLAHHVRAKYDLLHTVCSAAATSSESIVVCAVCPCNPALKLIGPFEKIQDIRVLIPAYVGARP